MHEVGTRSSHVFLPATEPSHEQKHHVKTTAKQSSVGELGGQRLGSGSCREGLAALRGLSATCFAVLVGAAMRREACMEGLSACDGSAGAGAWGDVLTASHADWAWVTPRPEVGWGPDGAFGFHTGCSPHNLNRNGGA